MQPSFSTSSQDVKDQGSGESESRGMMMAVEMAGHGMAHPLRWQLLGLQQRTLFDGLGSLQLQKGGSEFTGLQKKEQKNGP